MDARRDDDQAMNLRASVQRDGSFRDVHARKCNAKMLLV